MVQNCSRFSATRVGLAVLGGGDQLGPIPGSQRANAISCLALLHTRKAWDIADFSALL